MPDCTRCDDTGRLAVFYDPAMIQVTAVLPYASMRTMGHEDHNPHDIRTIARCSCPAGDQQPRSLTRWGETQPTPKHHREYAKAGDIAPEEEPECQW